VLLQRSGVHELVWFSHEKSVLQPVYERLRRKFGELQFTVHPDKQPIHVWHGGRVVGLVWPSAVPNPATFTAAMHEMALRRKPPEAAKTLSSIVLNQVRPALNEGPEKLWLAAHRLVNWLEGKPTDYSSAWTMRGLTEWGKCKEIEFDIGYQFKGTDVPVTHLFQAVAQGHTVAEFVANHPVVKVHQVEAVLEHLWVSISS
jgi:hypothetical protein